MFMCWYYMFFFFFFKQKTAYEMRISDWSSDVCSSDLNSSTNLETAPMSLALPTSSVPEATLRDLENLVDIAMAALGTPHEILTHDGRGPYLEKWHLSREDDGSARLMHHILRSDGDDELHDHPWDNRTLMVTYGYWEIPRDGRRWLAPGDIVIDRKTAG